MIDRIALDTSPLSLLSHPNEHEPQVKEIRDWLEAHLAAGTVIFMPEIADYEVRRELLVTWRINWPWWRELAGTIQRG